MKLLLLLLSLGLLVVGCQSSSNGVPGHVVPVEYNVQDGWQVE